MSHTLDPIMRMAPGTVYNSQPITRRGNQGTFHKFSPKHLQRYVDEFATRYNMREEDTQAMMAKTVEMMEGKRLTYKALIEDNGLSSGARG